MATLTKSLLPISGYTNQYYTYQCVVTENSYSITNNTSNVTVTFSIKGPWSPSFYEWVTYYGIVVDGSVKKTGSSSPYITSSYTQLLTWTGDIAHNSDGSKSINVGVYLYQDGPSNYLPKQYTSSSPLSMGSVSLTTIPRASTFGTISGNTIGSSMTVNINRYSSSFTHQLWYKLGNSAWYDLGSGIGTSKTFTISNDLLSQLPSSTSGSLQLCVRTYNGSTQIGSDVYKNVTVYVSSSVVPTIPNSAIKLEPQTYSLLIQGKNKLKVSASGCSAGTGSSIKSYTFSGPGVSSTTTATSVTSSLISNTGTLTYTVTVTDNRGRTASNTATITCYAWSAPSITLSAYRVNSSTSTTENDSGTYMRCTYNLSYSSVNNTNDVTVKILYKKNSASSYSSITALTDSTSTSGSVVLSSIDSASTYTVYATITDNYGGSSTSTSRTVFGASRVLNITSDGTGVAFGKMAESQKLFDVKWPIKSGDPAATMQNLSYRGYNLINSITNDTIANWNNQGNLATTFYTQSGQINGQPTQYGFLLNLTTGPGGQEAHQLWLAQNNGNISHRGGNSSGIATSWKTVLDSSNYTNYSQQKPTQLFSSSAGTIGTITLSESAANFTYLEIFYTDNNGRQPNSIRIYSPNGKYVSLSCIEPSTSGSDPSVYIRSSGWTISGTSMTVGRSDLSGANRGVYGQMYPHANGTNIDVKVEAQNYIKIFRILGYK